MSNLNRMVSFSLIFDWLDVGYSYFLHSKKTYHTNERFLETRKQNSIENSIELMATTHY